MSTASPTYFESAEASDVGRKRKNNEDACLRLPDNGVYCVADGMGGQAGGDLASQAIVAGLQEIFKKNSPADDDSLSRRLTLFRAGVNQASQWIKKFSDEKAVGLMGSTVVGLLVDPKNPRCAASLHAGDSRLYRFRAGDLQQITTDHSAVAMLAAKLGRSPESLPAKFQNDLLRAVGLTASVELDKNSLEVVSGDLFLLCSDGLTKMLKDDEIKQRLLAGLETPLAALARQLIDAANEAGGRDNVTVMLVKAAELPPAPANWSPEIEDDEDAMTALAPTVAFASEETSAPVHPDAADIHGETPQTENPAEMKFFPADKSPAASPPSVGVENIPAERKGISPAVLLLAFALIVGAAVWLWFSPQFAATKTEWLNRLNGIATNAPASAASPAMTTTNR